MEEKILDKLNEMNQKFDQFEQKINKIDQKVDQVNQKVDEIDKKLNQRIDEMEQKFDQRINELDQKFDQRINELNQKFHQKIDTLRNELKVEIGEDVERKILDHMFVFEEEYGKKLTIAFEELASKSTREQIQDESINELKRITQVSTAYVYTHEARIDELEKKLRLKELESERKQIQDISAENF